MEKIRLEVATKKQTGHKISRSKRQMDTCQCSFCLENANSVHVSKYFQLMAFLNIREHREVLGCCPGNVINNLRPDQRIKGLVA